MEPLTTYPSPGMILQVGLGLKVWNHLMVFSVCTRGWWNDSRVYHRYWIILSPQTLRFTSSVVGNKHSINGGLMLFFPSDRIRSKNHQHSPNKIIWDSRKNIEFIHSSCESLCSDGFLFSQDPSTLVKPGCRLDVGNSYFRETTRSAQKNRNNAVKWSISPQLPIYV